jgi:hypothetical protein
VSEAVPLASFGLWAPLEALETLSMSKPAEKPHPAPDEHFVQVRVITTAALYPPTGRERVPVHQKLDVLLKKAAHALELTDTSDFVVHVDDVEVDPTRSFDKLGLSDEVDLRWGPRAGAGGWA